MTALPSAGFSITVRVSVPTGPESPLLMAQQSAAAAPYGQQALACWMGGQGTEP